MEYRVIFVLVKFVTGKMRWWGKCDEMTFLKKNTLQHNEIL